jgi:flagellar hook-associated protein 2
MAGTINSLGIGSGVLTADIIDKLKASDTALIINPIDKKITLETQKKSALDLLNSLIMSFRSGVNALDDDALYQKRSVSGNTSNVNITAKSGVSIQSFSISDTVLAKKNVQQSEAFTSATAKVATSAPGGVMTVSSGGSSFNIDYTDTTSLEDIKNAINTNAFVTAANGTRQQKIQASILQVGTSDYRLILTSGETGADQAITLSDSVGGTLSDSLLSSKKTVSQSFTSTDTVASGAGSLTLAIGSNNYTLNYDTTTTLSSLKDAINTAVGAAVASIDSNNRLVIKSKVGGDAGILTLTDNTGSLNSKLTGYTTYSLMDEIQTAQDATFKYNGISITRKTNTIDDIVQGITINLLSETTSSANISIVQDTTSISDEMSTFVKSYNTLMTELNNMTTSDREKGTVGIFNGDSSIHAIRREVNRFITSINKDNYSLSIFGIDLNQNGTMSFNSSTFASKFNENPVLAEKFLSGASTTNTNGNVVTTDGVFTSLKSLMTGYTKSNGIMSTLTNGNNDELKSLAENKVRSQKLLEARYASMTARFIQYDAMISKLNSQFSSLQQQISMAMNGNGS